MKRFFFDHVSLGVRNAYCIWLFMPFPGFGKFSVILLNSFLCRQQVALILPVYQLCGNLIFNDIPEILDVLFIIVFLKPKGMSCLQALIFFLLLVLVCCWGFQLRFLSFLYARFLFFFFKISVSLLNCSFTFQNFPFNSSYVYLYSLIFHLV